jgi:DNA repair protein RecO (recombination protein O)
MAGERKRVDGETGFVLHAYPFRETSSIVEVFSRDHGRVPLVARGARRPRSQLRGVLMEFQPLELAWFGAGELLTLAKAEWLGGQRLLTGRALLFGYYLNELLLRLLAREDPHPSLFDSYWSVLRDLALAGAGPGLLRRFELVLLREIGYGLSLERDADSGDPVRGDRNYAYLLERGPVVAATPPDSGIFISGKALLGMARDDYSAPETLHQSKILMRALINYYLGGKSLNSRRVFKELQEL